MNTNASGLKQRMVRVGSPSGKVVDAILQVCECGGSAWYLYTVTLDGRDHTHLQCVKCDTTYCSRACALAAETNGEGGLP